MNDTLRTFSPEEAYLEGIEIFKAGLLKAWCYFQFSEGDLIRASRRGWEDAQNDCISEFKIHDWKNEGF